MAARMEGVVRWKEERELRNANFQLQSQVKGSLGVPSVTVRGSLCTNT